MKSEETRRYFEKYTRKELVKNWFYYHKWWLLLGAAALATVIAVVVGQVTRVRPDYQIGYVGEYTLPDGTVEALESALAGFGEDLNGDGRVVVQLNQYPVAGDAELSEPGARAAWETRLAADLMSGDSGLFLLSDPDGFQQAYEILGLPDGSQPSPGTPGSELTLRWDRCPALAALELGSYSSELLGQEISGENRQLVENLYLGCRVWGGDTAVQDLSDDAALWNRLTAGAAR